MYHPPWPSWKEFPVPLTLGPLWGGCEEAGDTLAPDCWPPRAVGQPPGETLTPGPHLPQYDLINRLMQGTFYKQGQA